MGDSIPRMSKEHREHLLSAFKSCRSWFVEGDLLVGDSDGWRIWLGQEEDGTCVGMASSIELGIKLEIPDRVAKVWLDSARKLLPS